LKIDVLRIETSSLNGIESENHINPSAAYMMCQHFSVFIVFDF